MKFVNISQTRQLVLGVGSVGVGETIEAPNSFNNPNFKEVEIEQKTKKKK